VSSISLRCCRLDHLGRLAGRRDGRRQRGGVQLLPPASVGRFTIQDSSNWVALAAFLVVAAPRELARGGHASAQPRCGGAPQEADLAAEMARLLLRGNNLAEALPTAAARLAQTLELARPRSRSTRSKATSARSRSRCARAPAVWGRCWSGRMPPESSLRRLQERVVPALEALLSAALEREGLLGGVVETAALRRADTVKTALLRAVSHDLRSPLTAISAAGEAIGSPSLSPQEREEMAIVIQEEARGSRGWSTTCSTSRALKPARRSRTAAGLRSRS
jgi:two-component system sensor histidine kinase KdpD